MRFYCLDWWSLILLVCFILLGLACRVGAMGSIYLLCLTCRLRRLTVWSLIFLGGFILFFQLSRVCWLFWVLLFLSDKSGRTAWQMIFGYLASRGTGKPPHSTLGHGITPYKKGVVGLWPRGWGNKRMRPINGRRREKRKRRTRLRFHLVWL